jgi:anti-anti-sigma regulatory factor
MPECHIYSAVTDGVCFIRLVGRLNFTTCARFDAFIRNIFLQLHFKAVAIDLCAVEHIDSTILGLLARIARYTLIRYGHKPKIYSTRPDMNLLLDTMCFETAFDIVRESPDLPDDLVEIPVLDDEKPNPGLVVLSAHKTLMRMNKQNETAFRDVVEQLEKEQE